MTAPALGKVSTREVPVDLVQRRRELQCRVTVDPEKVREYTAALEEGATLPAIEAVETGEDEVVLVDGWHRLEAAIRAKRATITVILTPGTLRDALRLAVGANARHGIPRSTADKRRAVYTLLEDAEWCALGSRELGAMAAVSHAFVSQVRREYGVAPGEVLTAERQAFVDGEPPPEWAALLAKRTSGYERDVVERVRTTRDFDALVALGEPNGASDALELRAGELATEDWPWPDDTDDRARSRRLLRLDTAADLAAAARSRDCPGDRTRLLRLRREVQLLEKGRFPYDIEATAKRMAGRPAVETRLRPMVEARARTRGKEQPWDAAARIVALPAREQAAAVLSCEEDVFANMSLPKLDPGVRVGALRQRLDPGRSAVACADPGCDGWIYRRTYNSTCVACGRSAEQVQAWKAGSLGGAARLLSHDGYGLQVDSVVVDIEAVSLLAAMLGMVAEGRTYQLPKAVREQFDAWRATQPALVVGVDGVVGAPAAPVGEEEEDEDPEDEDAGGLLAEADALALVAR